MYNFELKQLSQDNVIKETLNTIEFICEEYQLHDQLGIFTFSTTELLDHIITTIDNPNLEFDIDFLIDTRSVTIQINGNISLDFLQEQLSTSIDETHPLFGIIKLVDKIEFHNDLQQLSLTFEVHPQPTTLSTERVSNLTSQSVEQTENNSN